MNHSLRTTLYDSIVDVNGGGLGIYRLLPDDSVVPLFLSDSMGELSGVSHEEYVRAQEEDGSFRQVHPSDWPFFLDVVKRTISDSTAKSLAYRNMNRDGSYFWVNGLFFKPKGYGDAPVFGVLFTKASNLQDMQMRVLDNAPIGIHIIDLDSYELLYTNDSGFRLYGKVPSDYHGKKCYKMFFDRDSPCLHCKIDAVRSGITNNGFFLSSLGQYFTGIAGISTWNNRDILVEYISDDTERYVKSKQLEDIFTNTPGGIAMHVWICDRMVPLVISSQFEELLGEKAYLCMKKSSAAYQTNIHPGDREMLRNILMDAVGHLGNVDAVYRLFKAEDEKWLKLRLQGSFVKNPTGEILFYSVTTDITEYDKQKNALRVAEETTKAKSEFFSRLSHDLRTPMNGILGTAYLALDAKGEDALREGYQEIIMSGKYMLSLINDTLDINKIEAGKMTLKPSPCDEEEVFDGIIRMMEPSIKEKGIHFTFTKKGIDWAWMNIDAERVQQIFVNLLSNAVKFTHSGGHVSLTMECISIADGMVTDHFVVKDDGIGMSDEFQKHMFEPFAQEHRRDSEASGGSGLGLSIVSQLVSLMGGVICVDSAIGKGTEFAFNLCFPIADKPTEMKVLKTAVDSSTLKGKRILLCEDHPLNASIAVRILERVSAKVDVERNGKDGFERFLASVPGTYDAILMDIRMPVMDGLEATQAIRSSSHAEAKTIPIIAMSANAFDSDIETAQDVGMDGYVVKPVEPDDLYKKLAEAISGK